MARAAIARACFSSVTCLLGVVLLGVVFSTPSTTNTTVAVFLREQCNQCINITNLQILANEFVTTASVPFAVEVLPETAVCGEVGGLSTILETLSDTKTIAMVGSLDPLLCETVAGVAAIKEKPLVTWTCPQGPAQSDKMRYPTLVRLIPSLSATSDALATIVGHFRWRRVAILTIDAGRWVQLAHMVELALRKEGFMVRHHLVLQENDTLATRLRPLQTAPCRVLILCLPLLGSPLTDRLLTAIDDMSLAHLPNTTLLALHLTSPIPFLPPEPIPSASPLSPRKRHSSSSATTETTTTWLTTLSDTPPSVISEDSMIAVTEPPPTQRVTHTGRLPRSVERPGSAFEPPVTMSASTRRAMLVLTATRRHVGNWSLQSLEEDRKELWQLILEGLEIVSKWRRPQQNNISGISNDTIAKDCSRNWEERCGHRFLLLDWSEDTLRWRPLLQVEGNPPRRLAPLVPLLQDWARIKEGPIQAQDCSPDAEDGGSGCWEAPSSGGSDLIMRGAHIAAIVICSALSAAVVVVAAAIARKQLLKKRMSKGPYKILLTPSDFVFPHVPDTLRVDEGIEAMLCCWLQQLQEFGGPEVDKPDLLKGSIGSLRSHPQTKNAGSQNSLARNLLVDPKARYNGDLVQLKELPVQGTFELKSKAMDVLVTLHGLRHENLNPLIGCLTDPNRPALVFEWCSRGSLEDVLVQDEIKLDWSFRLSLLTDLVRGMRYLHSSPIRVHGYLTSRNCVIDARWVLKITDYGLPSFYDAQNIPPPSKSARDLLWTAPELLRNSGLRKTGTQPGDVYSFGIIMQEVVVRGEPFCMLSLSPEDIIEKVKKPPPLIRPSVSKGAAPPEAINIMRQCWAEQADMRPDINAVHDLFKKLNHGRKVNIVDTMFQMLEKYSNNLEELIRERTEQLDMEKKKTEQLLNRMLPSSVAEKLKLGMPVDPEDFREVTIYFSDIVGFTTISAYSTPFEVVDLLNDLYTCFDATINAFNVYKVETIGDAYMVVGGLPVRIPDHADQIATMALHLLHQSGRFKIRHLPYTPLRLRIGLHTGPCCAGVVGLTMPRYCLFGDTVNTASRMESTGSAWRIHLSQATKEQLDKVGGYQLEYRGEIDVKGKGKMHTYWLLGKVGFDKTLPTPPPLGLDERLIRLSRAGVGEGCETAMNSSFNSSSSGDGLTPPLAGTEQNVPAVEQKSSDPKSLRVSAAVHSEKANGDAISNESDSSSQHQQHQPNSELQGGGLSASSRGSSMKINASDHSAVAALLGVSTSSLSINSTGAVQYRGTGSSARQRRSGGIGTAAAVVAATARTEEDDLSMPYNHYRCLSPSEHHLNQLHVSKTSVSTAPTLAPSAASASRLLRRQFSLDRGDDAPSAVSVSAMTLDSVIPSTRPSGTGRLFKQNSAGAAHDLERIEEIPLGGSGASSPRSGIRRATGSNYFRQRCDLPPFSSPSMSVSVESLN